MKSRPLLVSLVVILILSSVVFDICKAAPSAQVTRLNIVIFQADVLPFATPLHWLMDKVKDKSKGQLIIEFRGGAEVASPPDIAPGVQAGRYDIGWVLNSLADSIVPGFRSITHMEVTPAEFRAKGVDYFQSLFNKAGLYWLGLAEAVEPQKDYLYLFTIKKRLQKPEDFAGLKMAIPSRMILPFLNRMGATPVIVNLTEYYTAVERGVVDGYLCSIPDMVQLSLHEKTKYVIDHSFCACANSFIVNLNVWNKLSKHQQDIMKAAAIEIENEFPAFHKKLVDDRRQRCLKAGMEFIKFSEADAKRYHDNMYRDGVWAFEIAQHPDVAPKMKELLVK